ncbi:adenosylcobinamide-phosphate synthase CbiB [Caulobacter sp. UNC279MFTsu5.1]|uniref:adenosylcobinamide-phosphate synthase CbiB n=1 Tax=Caulobacter sp. UNC279MFTsu5.1 TaxID=1502775 RepID=UPI0008EE6B7B|nr:adenosylcobinamide-phosphate synthase CbiB [Caulobacter sp. UNC279MFTsu5.1]SFK55910.1 adenosylcobinamide-phosphate synthase [Caulobacter sp. UNC279MFTsu5.1]
MADVPPWPWVTALALGLEAMLGYPAALNRLAGHPVAWPAALIEGLEQRWNRPTASDRRRRLLGVALVVLLVAASVLLGAAVQGLAGTSLAAQAFIALVATVGLAQRSLHDHVTAVLAPLRAGDLPTARAAVGLIVGRDTEPLDAEGVAAAALESLAESFNDGVVAPALWLLAGGLPGLFAYKSVNTADSLVGHREERWRMFGWAAARTDDLMNLAPARLAGGLIALAGARTFADGWRIMVRDARRHASPNAGWPEAAMAGALGVQLGGDAVYDGARTERPTFGDGPRPTAADLERGLRLYRRACLLLWTIPLAAGLIVVLAR